MPIEAAYKAATSSTPKTTASPSRKRCNTEAAYHNAAQYQESQREVVRDANLITASTMAAPAFSRAILEALGDIPAEVLAYLPAA